MNIRHPFQKLALLTALALSVGAPLSAAEPTAAAEWERWQFMLGEWQVAQKRFSFEGKLVEEAQGKSTFTPALGGERLVEHQSIVHAGNETEILHVFVFNPRTDEIEIARTDSGHYGFWVLRGTFAEGRIELSAKHPNPDSDLTRRVIYEPVGENGFRRRLDFSEDEGESWFTRSDQVYTRAGS